MTETRTFPCKFCGKAVTTNDDRKMFCNKKCADRSRNNPFPIGIINDLKGFGKLGQGAKNRILLGQEDFSVVMFDIEATHLKPNVGRILCTSFKPIGEPVYTFKALDPRYKKPDVYDDSELAKAVITELEKYDIIVGWNSKNFDVKFINSRAFRGGGRAKVAQYHIDGMWSWRTKMSAWSGLDAAQRFALPDNRTTKTSVEWEQWMRAIGWDKALREQAMAEIEDHCERDVVVLEDVYTRVVEAGMIRSLRRDGGVL